ncbi:hypothetical protein G7Y89_g10031 [Cudoniella acicularis]|uniref:Uncharacterized protein n=1 Tax=Cudoniella acicularis TaxID=354080 RepID=A0A8H4RG88_9HELO|nr:hypothetical protein G7Y89_g10031 [Cudoniella acicularis]
MKLFDIQRAIGAAILLLSLPCDGKHVRGLSHLEVLGRRHAHKRLNASPRVEGIESGLKKRTTCAFPTNAGLVAVTPGSSNAGWAMSPDQTCQPGSYCPYACPSGQVMAQWDPSATSYTYPQSMNGGLYCDNNGQISKPFPNSPYCVAGTGSVGAQNNCGSTVSFCQTVLPGNEAMLIPTSVNSWTQLAVPGANTDGNGNTFAKIGWNPIWTGSNLAGTPPTFGIKIVCSGSGCNGTPCSIDPSVNGVGGVTSADQASGAGGANFCVVTIPEGSTANIVMFTAGNSGSSGSGSSAAGSSSKASPSSTPTSTSTTSASPTPTPTTSSKPPSSTSSSSSSTSTTPTPSSTLTSSSSLSQTSSALLTSTSSTAAQSTTFSSSIQSSSTSYWSPTSSLNTSSSASPTASNSPHILFENQTSSQTVAVLPSGTGGATGTGNLTGIGSSTPTAAKKSSAQGMFASSNSLLVSAAFALAAAYLL